DYPKFDRIVQESHGRPVTITVVDKSSKASEKQIHPQFMQPFGRAPINFAGMIPRATIEQVNTNSSAKGKLLPGDVVLSIAYENGDMQQNLTPTQVSSLLEKAGQSGQKVNFTVLRDGKE